MYKVHIRRNSDNLVAVSELPYDYEDSNGSHYSWWASGNMCCNCNRELEFARALGDPEPEDLQCGEGKYSVLKFELPDGTIIEGPDE